MWWNKKKASATTRDSSGPLTFDELAAANRHRSEAASGFNQRIDAFTVSDRLVELMGEVGETANVAKKLTRIQKGGSRANKETEPELQAKLRLEVGDTLISLDLLCQRLGFTLEGCAVDAFNSKSREIGYEGQL